MSRHPENIWQVVFSRKAGKQKEALPPNIIKRLLALATQLILQGPIVPNWYHYGKLRGKKDTYHCHLNKGKPRYVAVWQVQDNYIRLMEVTYVGTHENAPYRR